MRALFLIAAIALAALIACGSNPPPKCSSANCMGCCTGAGDCLGGNTFFDCGSGAEICATCETGQACIRGACGAAPPDAGCGLTSCGGCCDEHDVCRSGLEDAACGAHANHCIDCTDAGFGCDMHACT
ncbi:MAG: hypothetical protein QM723_09395 [Myxococcaceae bacterium]